MYECLLRLAKGADGTDELYFFRDDIVTDTAMDGTYSDYCWVFGDIDTTGKDSLQASNDLC